MAEKRAAVAMEVTEAAKAAKAAKEVAKAPKEVERVEVHGKHFANQLRMVSCHCISGRTS